MTMKDFVCIGSTYWDECWRRRQQISSELSRHYRVLYLEPPVPFLKFKEFWKRFSLFNFKRRLRKINDNLYVFPLVAILPFGRVSAVKALNKAFMLHMVKKVSAYLEIMNPILWVWDFWEADKFIGRLGEKLIVYDCYDNYGGYPGVDKNKVKKIEILEKKVVKHSDITFVVSDELYQRISKWTKNIFKIPNGVDWNNYKKIYSSKRKVPLSIASVPHPIIGYMGGNFYDIDNKLDFKLIEHAAKNNPNWSFVFLGPYKNIKSREGLKRVHSLKNVYFLGKKQVEELPYYIDCFDVCMIPFISSKFISGSNPLKLYEYLACGKPIISTSFSAVIELNKEYPQTIKIANTYKDFTLRIKEALKDNNMEIRKYRISIAKQNSWYIRVKKMTEIIEYKLKEKMAQNQSSKSIFQVFNSRIQKHGSFEDFMIELSNRAKLNNLQVSFVFPCINTEEVREKLESLNAKIYTIEDSWKSFTFIKRLFRIILVEKPKIADFHFCCSINFAFFLPVLRVLGIRVIYHYHGEIIPIENLRLVNRHFSKLRLLTLFANKIICVSEANKKFLEALNIKKRITVVYNGINVKNFKKIEINRSFKKEMHFTNGELIVTSIASLIPRKGIDVLIKAAKDVIDEIPNTRFIFVGGGDKKPYQKLAEDLGISGKTVFTGLLKEYPYHILKDTDLYVSASFAESFGLSTAEAQLLGIPCVATKVGGVPEVVNNGNSGILIPPGDSKRLALEIIRLLKNKDLRRDLGNFSKKWIADKFNLEDMVEELIHALAN